MNISERYLAAHNQSLLKKVTFCFLSVVLLIAGCAATEDLNKANESFAQGEYEIALAHYQEALTANPDLEKNPEVQTKLQRAREECSSISYKKALVAADSGNADDAHALLRSAVEIWSANLDAAEALTSLSEVNGQNMYRLLFEAQNALKAKELDNAVQLLRQAIQQNRNDFKARIELHRAEMLRTAAYQLFDQAKEMVKSGELESAREKVSTALKTYPHLSGGVRLLEGVEKRRSQALAHFSQGITLSSRGDEIASRQCFIKALKTQPDFSFCKKSLAQSFFKEGQELDSQGKAENALARYWQAERYWPQLYGLKKSKPIAIKTVADNIRFCVGLFVRDSGHLGDRAREVEQRIKLELRRRIGDIAQVLGREELEEGLQAGLVDFVLVMDCELRVASECSLDKKSERYVSGRRVNREYLSLAAEAQTAKANFEETTLRLGQAPYENRELLTNVSRLSRYAQDKKPFVELEHQLLELDKMRIKAGGISALSSALSSAVAEARLASVPKYVAVHGWWNYAIEEYRRTASMKAYCKLLKVETGELLYENTFRVSTFDTDRAVKNPNPTTGILPDPLTIASGKILRRKLLMDELPKICSDIVNELRNSRACLFSQAAESCIVAGNKEGAITNYVKAAVTYAKTQTDEAEGILQKLEELLIYGIYCQQNK